MNVKNRSIARIGLLLGSAWVVLATGCATHVHQRTVYVPTPVVVPPPPPPVAVAPAPAPAPVVVIQAESDFYEPLNPYGQWVVIAGYGRCWVPARVEADWRPYADGYWQRTDAGWYWMSAEPWGWATYHYGRWDWQASFGWFWVPQTQWAPAWVAWREGGGYVGWAPLRPSVTIGGSLTSVNYEPAFASRAFVFVENRRMLEPVRPKTVIVNNTAIINQTVNITKVSVVNKTVINEGPRPEVIERESGRKLQPVAAREFRRREETAVTERERNLVRASGGYVQPQVPNEAGPTPGSTLHPRQEQVADRAPVIAKPVMSAPQPPTPIARPSRERAKANEVEHTGGRQVETPTSVKEAGSIAAGHEEREPQAVRPNTYRPVPRVAERQPELVTKPAPVITGPTHNNGRGSAEAVNPPAPRSPKMAPSLAAKSELKRKVEPTARPEPRSEASSISKERSSSPGNSSPRVQISPREKSRSTDRIEARKSKRNQGQAEVSH